jgi:hypothetical protein
MTKNELGAPTIMLKSVVVKIGFAVWLILTGLLPLLNVRISATVNTVLAVLAIGAGFLILLRR